MLNQAMAEKGTLPPPNQGPFGHPDTLQFFHVVYDFERMPAGVFIFFFRHRGSKTRLIEKGIVDPKLDYIGMKQNEIELFLGKPKNTYLENGAQHRKLYYEYILNSDIYARVSFSIDKYTDACEDLTVVWLTRY